MIIPASWLNSRLSLSLTASEIADRLSATGFESELIQDPLKIDKGLVVGKIVSVEKHPSADKLNVCQVDVGTEVIQIVCGCSTVSDAKYVVVAPVGSKLPGCAIEEVSLRNVKSSGMICSLSEIGFEVASKGIYHIPESEDVVAGQSVGELMGTSDLIDVDITPNRGDCIGLEGVVRDFAASQDIAYKAPTYQSRETTSDKLLDTLDGQTTGAEFAHMSIEQGVILPLDIYNLLRQCKVSSIHPVVDILNYVMLVTGQPMHAYDADTLTLPLHINYVKKAQSIQLLDESEYDIKPYDLVVCDAHQAHALAGVMGGDESKITSDTKNVLIESASFSPKGIAKTLRNCAINTDSSYRFERGVDPQLAEQAMVMAVTLLERLVGAKMMAYQSKSTATPKKTVSLNVEKVSSYLGITLTEPEIVNYMHRLGFDSAAKDALTFLVPSYRFDVSSDVDLIEEVARLYGYNNIPLMPFDCELAVPEIQNSLETSIKLALAAYGLNEVVSFPFVSSEALNYFSDSQSTVKLSNPINANAPYMRSHIWQSMIQVLQYNHARQQSDLRIFESGHVYLKDSDGNLYEQLVIGGALSGRQSKQFLNAEREYNYYDGQALVVSLLKNLGYEQVVFKPVSIPGLHYVQAASIMIGDICVGSVGRMHPQLVRNLGLGLTIVFDINIDVLPELPSPKVQMPSKYPSVHRDITVSCASGLAVYEIIEFCNQQGIENLVSVSHVDTFETESGANITLALQFQSYDKTCSDKKVAQETERLINLLGKQFAK